MISDEIYSLSSTLRAKLLLFFDMSKKYAIFVMSGAIFEYLCLLYYSSAEFLVFWRFCAEGTHLPEKYSSFLS